MRSRISIRGCVRPSVGWSVRPSHTSWNQLKMPFLTRTTTSTGKNASYAVYPALFAYIWGNQIWILSPTIIGLRWKLTMPYRDQRGAMATTYGRPPLTTNCRVTCFPWKKTAWNRATWHYDTLCACSLVRLLACSHICILRNDEKLFEGRELSYHFRLSCTMHKGPYRNSISILLPPLSHF